MIQSIHFNREKWTLTSSIRWLLKHNFKIKKVDVTERFLKFRQLVPNAFRKFYTKQLPNGINLIIGIL
jgi:hypothetical protein